MLVAGTFKSSFSKSLQFLVVGAVSLSLNTILPAVAQAPQPIAPATPAAPSTPAATAPIAMPTASSAPADAPSAPAAPAPLVHPKANAYDGSSASTESLPNANPKRKPEHPPDPFKMASVVENNPVYTVDVKYPQFDSIKGNDPSKLNEEIKRFVMAQIDASRAVMPAKMQHIEGPKPLSYIKGVCNVSLYDSDLCSLTVDLTNYAYQSAHPVEALSTFNYRLDTNQRFVLKDVFRPEFKYIPAISKICIAKLSAGLDEDGIDWVRRGAAAEEKNFGKFQVSADGLKIIFDPYTIDNGSDGFRTVAISWDRVRASVSTEAPFHKLIKR
jgi:hypothetical protein